VSEDTKIPTDIDLFVGRRVRARRLELNLTQQALAEQAGVTFQQLQKYENGANRISAGRLYDLAQALNASIQFFYEGVEALLAGRRGVAEDQADFQHGPPVDAADLVIAYMAIPDAAERKALLAQAKRAAGQ
jgi:transcriptional regulator with XRE-family HTH domain